MLDDTRQALAQYYLKQSSISPSEISFLLGFQEVNSFARAFKSWTGHTPNTYRLQSYCYLTLHGFESYTKQLNPLIISFSKTSHSANSGCVNKVCDTKP
ncbi:helix-turn-helix domain-containing protein [Acinetobacter piscicola]|uniref:helix-turn-helix domain-containing protein n=1 Tax=Acinetobacter piscicola TaxID=2006115 RepID=UPI001E36C5F3|nr:AraC family transcriptional regulator [Acinetobacter piscicola]